MNKVGWQWMLIFYLLVSYQGKAFASDDNSTIDSLKQLLRYAPSDTSKVWILRDIAFYYQSIDSDSAIHYSDRGYKLAMSLNHTYGAIWTLYQLSLAYELNNESEQAFANYHRALLMAEEASDLLSMAKLNNAIGVSHYYAGALTEAVRYYLVGYQLSDSLDYNAGKAYALNNLGVIYRKQRRYHKALDVYLKSLAIKEIEKDSQGIVVSLYNVGLIYAYLNQYEESLNRLTQAKHLANTTSNLYWDVSHLDIALGVALYHLNDLQKSQEYIISALQTFDPSSSTEYIYGLGYLGSILVRTGNPGSGLDSLLKANRLAQKTNNKELQREILRELAKAGELSKQYELAAKSWRDYNILSDSLHESSKNWAMEEMQTRFELQEKEVTIAKQTIAIQKEQSRKNLYFISGLSLVVLLILSGIFLRLFWRKKEQLRIAFDLKQKALNVNELLMREMHHRTKNNLQLLNSLLSMQWRKVSSLDGKKALQSSRDSVGAISLLHHRLYKNDDFRQVSLKPYISDLTKHFDGAFGLKSRNITIDYACEDVVIDTDKAIHIGLVINELVTNAIIHAFGDGHEGHIQINVFTVGDELTIAVEDNGVGLSLADEQSTGLGIQLIHILGERYSGRFEMKNTSNGTTAVFILPFTDIKQSYE